MADSRDLRPVQVFLDTKKFIETQEVRAPRGRHDFFADNDRGFAAHKAKVRRRLQNISATLKAQNEPAGFMRVQMRENALAKSYRPLGSLFTEAIEVGIPIIDLPEETRGATFSLVRKSRDRDFAFQDASGSSIWRKAGEICRSLSGRIRSGRPGIDNVALIVAGASGKK